MPTNMTRDPIFAELDALIAEAPPPPRKLYRTYRLGQRRARMAELEAQMREKYGGLRRREQAYRNWEARRRALTDPGREQ